MRYWQSNPQPRRHATPEDAAKELRTLLDTAVRTRIPATGTVAAHLSGGIDSYSICTLASRVLSQEAPKAQDRAVHAFCFWPQDHPELAQSRERPFVEAILAHDPAIVLHRIPSGLASPWLTAGSHQGRLLPLSHPEPEAAVCRHAAAIGAESILSGWGGDESPTFEGQGVLANALLTMQWSYFAEELRAVARMRGWTATRAVLHEVLPYVVPRSVLRVQHRLRHRRRRFDDEWRDLLHPELIAATAKEKSGGLPWPGPSPQANQLRLIRSGYLSWQTTTWASHGAQHGIAFTFPMLDRRLVEFHLSLPAGWHMRGGWKRRPIRDATHDLLPEAVRWRRDESVPYLQMLEELPEQREALLRYVNELAQNETVRSIFRTDRLQALAAAMPTVEQARTTHRCAAASVGVNLMNTIHCCNFLKWNF